MQDEDSNSIGPMDLSPELMTLLNNRDISKIDNKFERELSNAENSVLIREIANSFLSVEAIELLSSSKSWQLLVSLAANPSVPHDNLQKIIANTGVGIYQYEVQQSVLISHISSKEIKDSILKGRQPGLWSHLDEKEITRRKEVLKRSVVANSFSVGSELASLATWFCYEDNKIGAEEIWIRKYGYPHPEALTAFETIDHYSWDELQRFAIHPMTSRENLVKLSFSNDEELEALVASNPSTPPCIVAYYVETLHANLEPLSLALANPVVPSFVWPWFLEVSEHFSDEEEAHNLLLQTAAINHGLPEEMMERLLKHPSIVVRENMSKNVCLPAHLKKLI